MDAAHQIALQEAPANVETERETVSTPAESAEKLQLTLAQLRKFDGKDGGRILVSLKGRILDVSSGAESYGPDGPYALFGGRDVTKCLALMNLSEDFLDQHEYVPEDEDGKKSLDSWWSRLSGKYPEVGEIVHPLRL